MIDSIQNILVQVSDFLWSYIIITVLICCALLFTWRTRFVQFRLIREMVRLLIHPDKVQPEEIGHDELSMEVKVDGGESGWRNETHFFLPGICGSIG